jgi:hypothetical protein
MRPIAHRDSQTVIIKDCRPLDKSQISTAGGAQSSDVTKPLGNKQTTCPVALTTCRNKSMQVIDLAGPGAPPTTHAPGSTQATRIASTWSRSARVSMRRCCALIPPVGTSARSSSASPVFPYDQPTQVLRALHIQPDAPFVPPVQQRCARCGYQSSRCHRLPMRLNPSAKLFQHSETLDYFGPIQSLMFNAFGKSGSGGRPLRTANQLSIELGPGSAPSRVHPPEAATTSAHRCCRGQ